MRALQAKQPPTVSFTYQGSPPSKQPRSQSVSRPLQPPSLLPDQPLRYAETLQPRKALAFGESSHIKVVDEQERRERRHRIFQEVGVLARSKSKERNRSFSIFNGARESNQVKELVLSKESLKEQSVQTDALNERKPISNFTPEPVPYFRPLPAHPAPAPPPQQQSLERELERKEKELLLLRMEVERRERCERLTHENESIYKRLVEKLDSLSSENATLQRTLQQQKSKRHSPHKHDSALASAKRSHRQEGSPSDTTRFAHPPSTKRESVRKEVLANALNRAPEPSQQRDNTVTFYRHDHRKTHGNKSAHYHPMASEEELRERLEESVRRYTCTVNLDEVPVEDKLSSINRHLETLYAIRGHSRPASHSRYSQRGRSIASSRAPRHA